MYRTVKVVAGSPEHRKLAAEGWERTLTANGRIITLFKFDHESYIANRADEYMATTTTWVGSFTPEVTEWN